MRKSSTKAIIEAMRILANEGWVNEEGVAHAAIAEAADRLEELEIQLKEAQDYADKLVKHKDMVCLPKDLENLRETNTHFAQENFELKQKLFTLEYIYGNNKSTKSLHFGG